MHKVTNFLRAQAHRLFYSDLTRKAAHTFWQTALAVLLVGIVSVHDLKTALALAVAAVAAGASAVKTYLVTRYGAGN